MQTGLLLESTMRTLLHYQDPHSKVAWMATEHQDRYCATDMWVRACPVQLTTIKPTYYGGLMSKARVALQSMPSAPRRFILSVDPHVAGNAQVLSRVLVYLATYKEGGDHVFYVDPTGEIHNITKEQLAA